VTAKRLFDVALSGLGLLASAPCWALIAAAITLDTPPFYTQPRVGQRGRIFDALKFRSMVRDAERGVDRSRPDPTIPE
jgi:lipopolysaccharide/colanic/teichoic acid biosynthesis glycosyltransferase